MCILNLNVFEILWLEINRYDDYGELISTEAAYIQSGGVQTENGNVHANTHPDRGYANVQIFGAEYEIERDSVQNHLDKLYR